MRKNSNIKVALDIGSSKMRAMAGEFQPSGRLSILGMTEADAPEAPLGMGMDYELTTTRVYQVLSQLEKKAKKKIGEVILTSSHLKTTWTDPMPVDLYEDRKEVMEPVMLHRFRTSDRVDYATISIHSKITEKTRHTNREVYRSLTVTPDSLNTALKIVKSVGLDVADVVYGPLAASQLIPKESLKVGRSLLIDLQEDNTRYLLIDREGVKLSGEVEVGGNDLIRMLCRTFPLCFKEAGEFITTHGTNLEGGLSKGINPYDQIDPVKYRDILHKTLSTALSLVQLKVTQHSIWATPCTSVYLTGGLAAMPGIRELAQNVFTEPVSILSPSDTQKLSNPAYSTVYGLLKFRRECS